MRKVLTAVFLIVIVLILCVSAFMQRNFVVPILMYHYIASDSAEWDKLSVTPEGFKRQMGFLKRHHYNVLPLEELARLIKEKKRIPARTVAITFDDGYKNNFTNAFPILKKYNFPATVFLIVEEIGRPQDDRLNWEEIKIMQDSGLITFGSHTLGPKPLTTISSEDEIKRQIFESKRVLEQKLGRRVTAFSYPEGGFNAKIKQMVKDAGYTSAVATSPGKKFPGDDLFALKRLRISNNCNNPLVMWIETSGLYTYIKEHRDKD